MSFLYPRTIAITRPEGQTALGAVGYGGVTKAAETPVVSDIPASIQGKAASSRPHSGDLPAAPPGPPQWSIYIPLEAVAEGVIQDRDIVTDDLDSRYQVISAYWNSLGYKLMCIRLEAH